MVLTVEMEAALDSVDSVDGEGPHAIFMICLIIENIQNLQEIVNRRPETLNSRRSVH